MHRNVRLLQAHTLCFNAIFILPVLIPYYKEVIGLGFQEFLIGEAVFSAVVIFMEVPTGWLSDVWGRKKTLIASSVVSISGWVILWQANSFAMTVLAQGTLGIAISLLSGTNSALLYDSLLEEGSEHDYRRLEGFRHGLGLYTVGGAALLGGFLYDWDPQIPIMMTLSFNILALCFALGTIEPSRHREEAHPNPFVDMAKTIQYAVHGHVEIAGIILLSAVLFAGTKVLLWIQQPYYILLNLPLGWFGILTAFGFLLGGLAGHYGHLLKGGHGDRNLLIFLLSFLTGACLVSGLWPGWYGIPLILSGSLVWGFGFPRVQDAINKRVASTRRATILSAASLMMHVTSIPLFVLIGRVSESSGIAMSLLTLSGGLLVVGSGAFLLLKIARSNNAQ